MPAFAVSGGGGRGSANVVASATLSGSANVDVVLKRLKARLDNNSRWQDAFHAVDKDRSNELSAEEFAAALKLCEIVLPDHVLASLVARFDANGDGNVSIQEFKAFILGDTERFDMLRAYKGPASNGTAGDVGPAARPFMLRSMRHTLRGAALHDPLTVSALKSIRPMSAPAEVWQPRRRELTETELFFLSRMDNDVEHRLFRRHYAPREPDVLDARLALQPPHAPPSKLSVESKVLARKSKKLAASQSHAALRPSSSHAGLRASASHAALAQALAQAPPTKMHKGWMTGLEPPKPTSAYEATLQWGPFGGYW